nr:HAD-IA family hydrolase [Salsuginibacillus kocurii]
MQTQSLRAGVIEYLEEAKALGLKVAIASSSEYKWVSYYLKTHQIHHYFDAIATFDDVERKKPCPDVYSKVLEKLNVQEKEAIAFEDSLNGLKAAKNAGLKCVVVPNSITKNLPFEQYDRRLNSMADTSLQDIIKADN